MIDFRALFIHYVFLFTLTLANSCPCFPQQPKAGVVDLLRLFPKTAVPACIDYAKDKFARADNQQGEILPKPRNLFIKAALVGRFLLAPKEQSYYYNEFGDTAECMFYAVKQLVTAMPFHIIAYERQYRLKEWTYSEKFLCTLSTQGKLISKIAVASYYQQDFYISSAGRVPFYAEKKACITKDLRINVIIVSDNAASKNDVESSWLIDSGGRILRQAKSDHYGR